jgi:hypothetical protein
MAKTDFSENQILNHYFNRSAMPAMAPTYLGLLTSAPSDAGGGAEVVGDAYARQNVTGKFGAPANGAITNSAVIAFPTPTGDGWGDISHVGLWDAVTGGNLLRYVPLAQVQTVAAGNPPSFAAGALTFRED